MSYEVYILIVRSTFCATKLLYLEVLCWLFKYICSRHSRDDIAKLASYPIPHPRIIVMFCFLFDRSDRIDLLITHICMTRYRPRTSNICYRQRFFGQCTAREATGGQAREVDGTRSRRRQGQVGAPVHHAGHMHIESEIHTHT